MNLISSVSSSSALSFGKATIQMRSYHQMVDQYARPPQPAGPSAESLLKIHQLREALSALKPGKLQRTSSSIAAQAASAVSTSRVNFSTGGSIQLRSVEEINTAPTSFQQNGPVWNGSTETAPWSGLGSTADASLGGSYDGSNGMGTLQFQVTRAGTHGGDDLKIKIFDDGGNQIETIDIDKNDPLNHAYELSNGLSLTLGAGDLVKNDYFEVDLSVLSTSYTPNDPGWTGSSAAANIGGLYLGTNGTGDLTFNVTRAGVHGEDDLTLKVYDPDDNQIDTINVKKNDAIDKVYSLSNGLTFTLGEGELIKNETFTVSVDATNPANYTSDPEWNLGTSTATLTGTYDGSNGTGTLTFLARGSGVHGEDDVQVRVFAPDGSVLDNLDIVAGDPIDTAYELSNGLFVTFSAGELIKNETFTVDVEAQGSFSTSPNPVESTAEPAISGVYDGSLGTDVLEFTVTQEGVHGTDDLAFDVRTSDGTLIESFSVLATDSPDQVYSLSNGIDFTLGAGALALNETFTVGINHLVPTSVDPDLSFDATGINDAKLEDQFTITDGSFEINGNTIAVFANDSINSVLNRINTAGIDVTAVFDVASETILMTHDIGGSEDEIVLSSDTSGFLAATKLVNAVSSSGTGDETTPLAQLESMAGVSSGTLQINGTSIAIDVNNDSLEDVLSRIDILLPDVEADFDAETGLVSFQATDLADLEISSGGTGFFEAVSIAPGTYESVAGQTGVSSNKGLSYHSRRETVRAINQFTRRFNAVFENKYNEEVDPYLQEIRNELKTAITAAFTTENAEQASSLGISADFQSEKGPFEISGAVEKQLHKSLKTATGVKEFAELFFENDQDDGIVERMLSAVKSSARDLGLELAMTGSFVDVWA